MSSSSSLSLLLHSRGKTDVSDDMEVLDSEYLSSKNAVNFLINGTLKKKVCRYCLNVSSSLSELDMIQQVAGQGTIYKVTIREMIASFHPVKVVDDQNFPNKICNRCLDRTLSSYLFSQQCEQSERALRNCFEDIYDKLEKLDPLEKQKKPGRQKLHLNHNILYAEHEKVIDYAEPLITMVNTATEFIVNNNDAKNNVKSNYICPKCCQKMPSLESLLNHEKSHPSSMLYHCHLCGKSFPKRSYLRRHIPGHTLGKQVLQNTDFKCLECNVVSKDYHIHLQHIEKHRFKQAIQNLILRKTDKLCAVCLNNGTHLIELEDMICLHGGYPEMMGDRTMYQILGSTVPEKSSYKYRELLLPSQAKILTIKKLQKVKADSKLNFILSHPYVISKDNISFDKSDQFVFTSPYKNLNLIDGFDDSYAYDEVNEIKNTDDKYLSHDKERPVSSGSFKDINKFSKTNNFDTIKKTEDEHVLRDTYKINKSCKTCWIFKSSSYKTCLGHIDGVAAEKNNSLLNQQDIELYKQPCPSCWLFKNCKECEYCKKQNNETTFNTDTIPESSSQINVCDIQNNLNVREGNKFLIKSRHDKTDDVVCLKKKKRIEDQSDCRIHQDIVKTRKRKITNEADDAKAKKSKWECKICLMMNTNRQLCFCCDAPRTLNQIKFKFNKDFFKDLNNKKNNTGHSSKVEPETNSKVDEAISVVNEFENIAISGAVKGDIGGITEALNHGVTYDSCDGMKVDPNINVDNIDFNSMNTQTQHVEEMEIVDDTPQIEQNTKTLKDTIQVNPSYSVIEISPFHFNIGIGTTTPKSSERKIMRSRKKSYAYKKSTINTMGEEF